MKVNNDLCCAQWIDYTVKGTIKYTYCKLKELCDSKIYSSHLFKTASSIHDLSLQEERHRYMVITL